MSIGLAADNPRSAVQEKDSAVAGMYRSLSGQLNRVDESLAELLYRLQAVLQPENTERPATVPVPVDNQPYVRIVDMLSASVARVEAQADRLRQILSRLDV